MKLSSSAFEPEGTIPDRFSRDGGNRSPPLTVREVPLEAVSLALIMDDPDAPGGTFTHWVAFNLDPVDQEIEEAVELPEECRGRNDWDETGYGGPQPPDGEHRYYFRVYALDRRLELNGGATRAEVEDAMRKVIVAQAQTMGRFGAS